MNAVKPTGYATTILSIHMRQCDRLIMELMPFSTFVTIAASGRPMYWIFLKK